MGLYNPIFIDFKDVRTSRQDLNNQLVYNSIKNNDMKSFNENINKKALERSINRTKKNKEELIKKCQVDEIFALEWSASIAKNASRQGTKDENLQLITSNEITKNFNINIQNLSSTAYRPKKSGEIISKKEMEDNEIPYDQCLKSFDGKITGEIEGWIFAKVCFGGGGGQDSVFIEANYFSEWVKTHHNNENNFYVLLIETDLIKKLNALKEKYKDIKNLFIGNHYEFQQYIIDQYSSKT